MKIRPTQMYLVRQPNGRYRFQSEWNLTDWAIFRLGPVLLVVGGIAMLVVTLTVGPAHARPLLDPDAAYVPASAFVDEPGCDRRIVTTQGVGVMQYAASSADVVFKVRREDGSLRRVVRVPALDAGETAGIEVRVRHGHVKRVAVFVDGVRLRQRVTVRPLAGCPLGS